MKRWPVLVSFVLFIALCISATYWAMQLFRSQPRPVAAPPQASMQPVRLDAAQALFGGRAAMVAVASNFQLKGVVVSDRPHESVAILAAEGKPAQAIVLNAEAAPGVTVKEVHAKYVLLSEGGVSKRVDLPESTQSQLGGNDAAGEPPPVQMAQPAPPAPAPAPAPAPPSMATTPMAAPAANRPPPDVGNPNAYQPPGAMPNR